MSAKNRVNPDHYKGAGRDRPNESILQERHKQKMSRAKARIATGEAAQSGRKHDDKQENPPAKAEEGAQDQL